MTMAFDYFPLTFVYHTRNEHIIFFLYIFAYSSVKVVVGCNCHLQA